MTTGLTSQMLGLFSKLLGLTSQLPTNTQNKCFCKSQDTA